MHCKHTLYRGQALTVQHNLRSVTIRHQLLLDQGLRELKCDIFSRQLLVDSCERLQLRERDGGREGGRERGREGWRERGRERGREGGREGGRGGGGERGRKGGEREGERKGIVSNIVLPMVKQLSKQLVLSIFLLIYTKSITLCEYLRLKV